MTLERSAALSMVLAPKEGIRTRKVAIFAADGVDGSDVTAMQQALKAAGAEAKVVAPRSGVLKTQQGAELPIDYSLLTVGSVLVDGAYVPGGEKSIERSPGRRRRIFF